MVVLSEVVSGVTLVTLVWARIQGRELTFSRDAILTRLHPDSIQSSKRRSGVDARINSSCEPQ